MTSKIFGIVVILMISWAMFGGSSSIGNSVAANNVVIFPDPNLEDAIRDAIQKPIGDIYSSDLLGLTYLDASERNIVDLTGLEHATSLTKLNLNLNQISDISHLTNLTSLTELDLFANQISDISPLANLISLTRLMLRSNQVGDVSPLANLSSLIRLDLTDNQISNISSLADLTNLTMLELYYNRISNVSPLADLTSLTILYLDNNQISDISSLADLTNLTTLALFENQVSDISPLANLTNLISLQLQHNQISDISPLTNLTNLISLHLHYNQISDISPLANLISLKWLYLVGNQISDISPLVENEGLSAGDEVDLRWNPLSVTSVNTDIPQLEARGVDVLYNDSSSEFWVLIYQADLSDVEPGNKADLMNTTKGVIERRIDALGITDPIITVQEQGGEWSIAIQLTGIGEIDRVKKLIVRFALLEFKEQDEEGNWIPATGTVGGKQLILSSRYFKENTYVTVDQYGRPLLVFELDETGQDLFQQISSRLIGKPLAIYLGDEPLRGEDGHVIAPIVEEVIEDKGQIQGLSLADAQELSQLLNAGHIPVPLGRWVVEGQSKVFEPNVPVYEGQIPEQAPECSLAPPTLINPTDGATETVLRPTFSWSSVSGANRYWLLVASDRSLLTTEPADEFCEVYYLPMEDGSLEPITLYYPAYYNSVVVRLYNFNGKAVTSTQPIVISYQEKEYGGEKYKEITSGQYFSSYEDAQAYVAAQTSGNYRVVGDSPLSSPVPLEELDSDVTLVPGAVISEIELTSTSYTPTSNLDHGTTYWWQVQAFNWDGSKVIQLGEYSAHHSFTTEQEDVTLTLYVHEDSISGPIIAGARVTGQDGAGASFDKTIGSSGYATITGTSGTWSLTVAKTGYQTISWFQSVTTTGEQHVYLLTESDTTSPTTPSVTADGGSFAGTTELHASWNSADPESGISEYQYAVGTTAGGSDVVDWTSVGTTTEVTKSVAGLNVGKTYYFAVKAKNGQGLWSDAGTSNGIVVTAVILDFPLDWTDNQLFVPIYERPNDTPGTVVLGVHNKRDMWYLVKVYTRQGNGIWKEYNQTGWILPYLRPWGEKTFTYTPRLGEEIKIEVSNDLNDDNLRALWCLDFATRSLLGVSISSEVTDPEAFFVELLTFYNKYLQIGAYLGSGQYDEAVYHLGRALLEPMAMGAFYHLLVQLGVQISRSLITAKIVGVLFHFGVYLPLWLDFIHNTGKQPFIEEIILTARARTLLVSPDIRVTGSLGLIEEGPYHSGETITAQFTVKNMGPSAIELNILTAGGRGPEGDNDVRDFSYDTAVMLNPGDSHSYEGELFLSDTGHYHFFITYQTSDGQWYTSVPTEGSATNTLDIDVGPLPDMIVADICSPGELRVYDSYGRVTGLVSGEVREEIPDSSYYDGIAVIFSPLDSYTYEVVGTDDGTYGLNIIFVENGVANTFSRANTPIAPAAVHLYSVDWDALSQGGESVTVQLDADGDGTFEEITMIRPPVAFFTYSSENPAAADELTFDASESYDVDGSIISYEWDFGEGNTSTGEIATHAYSLPGEYLVSLVVVDNDGAVSAQSRIIQVRERQGMPVWGWAIIGVGIVVIAVIVLRRYRLVKR